MMAAIVVWLNDDYFGGVVNWWGVLGNGVDSDVVLCVDGGGAH